MKDCTKTALLLVILGLVYTDAVNVIWDSDDSASVEVEDDNYIDEGLRDARIHWPYPLKHQHDEKQKWDQRNDQREKRFILSHYSYPQSPIADLMKQTMAYEPNNKDVFDFLRDHYPLPKGFSHPLDEYDYVIIGGGSAGSVLASRLTEEKPRATVLLIEAGKPECLLSDIPMYVPYLQLSDYSWPYTTEPQPGINCLGSEGGRCFWPRGRALGGSSVTDYMLYSRGRPQDWDRIAADGNYGWAYNDILPYFIKSEKSTLKKYKDSPYSGQQGELLVSNPPFRTGLVEAFLAAGRINGHPTIDYNSPEELGFGYVQTTTFKGHRWSTAKAWLHPHKRRRNLHILTSAKATKIIIEPHSKRAYAVEYIRNNIKHKVRARREIILSAGPIGSPQLLMLSGIGPKEHLQQLGIPVLADIQVGRLLYDHLAFPGVIFGLNSTNASLLEPKILTVQNLVQWLTYGDSLLASPGTVESLGFLKTNVSDDPDPNVPDIELLVLGTGVALDCGGILRQSWRISAETYFPAFGALCNHDQWQAIPLLLHPKSRGYLELRDTNPDSHPKIYSNYLTDHRDVKTMVAAIKHVIQLGESEPFKKYGAQLHKTEYPQCTGYAFNTDEYWECALRVLGITMYDQSSTCKMGPPSDPEAVVDPELRVYGVEGLRVVDSSVIPRTTSAHVNTLAIMIAERAADLIKHTWANVGKINEQYAGYGYEGNSKK